MVKGPIVLRVSTPFTHTFVEPGSIFTGKTWRVIGGPDSASRKLKASEAEGAIGEGVTVYVGEGLAVGVKLGVFVAVSEIAVGLAEGVTVGTIGAGAAHEAIKVEPIIKTQDFFNMCISVC